jgi:hypothetical protein
MSPSKRQDIYDAVSDAKNSLMRALRAAEGVKGANDIIKRLESATARVEAIQKKVKP